MEHRRSAERHHARPAVLVALLVVAALQGGCFVEYLLAPRRHATVWTRSSGEYAATTLQVYAAAHLALERALADPSWTAALEQTGEFETLPPAVILDLDETVLDNTRFHAMLDENELPFDEKRWADWVHQARAHAVPGASAFLAFAQRRGVQIFYITNRDHALETSTRENLRALAMPLDPDVDTMLTLHEHAGWNRGKSSRRAYVTRSHRVLLIVGDSLGDFIESEDLSAERMREEAFRHENMWGRRWFVVPNPIYGGWEREIAPIRPPALRQ